MCYQPHLHFWVCDLWGEIIPSTSNSVLGAHKHATSCWEGEKHSCGYFIIKKSNPLQQLGISTLHLLRQTTPVSSGSTLPLYNSTAPQSSPFIHMAPSLMTTIFLYYHCFILILPTLILLKIERKHCCPLRCDKLCLNVEHHN